MVQGDKNEQSEYADKVDELLSYTHADTQSTYLENNSDSVSIFSRPSRISNKSYLSFLQSQLDEEKQKRKHLEKELNEIRKMSS